jgi:hypothetical protein
MSMASLDANHVKIQAILEARTSGSGWGCACWGFQACCEECRESTAVAREVTHVLNFCSTPIKSTAIATTTTMAEVVAVIPKAHRKLKKDGRSQRFHEILTRTSTSQSKERVFEGASVDSVDG